MKNLSNTKPTSLNDILIDTQKRQNELIVYEKLENKINQRQNKDCEIIPELLFSIRKNLNESEDYLNMAIIIISLEEKLNTLVFLYFINYALTLQRNVYSNEQFIQKYINNSSNIKYKISNKSRSEAMNLLLISIKSAIDLSEKQMKFTRNTIINTSNKILINKIATHIDSAIKYLNPDNENMKLDFALMQINDANTKIKLLEFIIKHIQDIEKYVAIQQKSLQNTTKLNSETNYKIVRLKKLETVVTKYLISINSIWSKLSNLFLYIILFIPKLVASFFYQNNKLIFNTEELYEPSSIFRDEISQSEHYDYGKQEELPEFTIFLAK